MAGKSSINGLLAAAKEESTKVQSIKSVAEGNETAIIKTENTTSEEEVLMNASENNNPETFEELILSKREEKDTEIVRVPRSIHKELKLLSSMTGVPIGHIVANLLEAGTKQYSKEINSLKKKYIKTL